MSHHRRFFFLLSTLIAWAYFATSAQAASWLAGPVMGSGVVSRFDSVAVDSAGNSTFAWTEFTTGPNAFIQRQDPEGTLGPAQKLPNGMAPDVESTDTGTVFAWYEADSSDPEVPGGKVKIRRLDAGGSPTATTTVATVDSRIAAPPSIAVTPGGDVAVVWVEEAASVGDPPTLHFRKINANGQLGPQLNLGPIDLPVPGVGGTPAGVNLAMTPDGRAYLGWMAGVPVDPNDPGAGNTKTGLLARFTPSGQPDGTQVLTAENETPSDVQVFAGPGGAVVTWRLVDGDPNSVTSSLMAAKLSASGPVAGSPHPISDGVLYMGSMVAAYVGSDGSVTIIYAKSAALFDAILYVRRLGKDGTLGPPSRVSGDQPSELGAISPTLAPDRNGSLLAAWMQVSVDPASPISMPSTQLVSRSIAANGTPAGKTSIAPGGEKSFVGLQKIAGNGKGDITMAWARYEQLPGSSQPVSMKIHSAFYYSLPPRVVASIPKKLKRGQNGRMSVTATSKSGIADIEWDFGDGSSAKGASVGHIFGRAGNYKLTVTVTDNGGESTVVSRKLNVYEPGSKRRAPAHLKLTKVVRKKRLVKITGKINRRASGKVHISWKQRAGQMTHTLKLSTKISKGRFKATVRLDGELSRSKSPAKLKVTYGGNRKTRPGRVSRTVKS